MKEGPAHPVRGLADLSLVVPSPQCLTGALVCLPLTGEAGVVIIMFRGGSLILDSKLLPSVGLSKSTAYLYLYLSLRSGNESR